MQIYILIIKTYSDFRVHKILKIFILGFKSYSHSYDENIETFSNIFKAKLFKTAKRYLNKCLKLDKLLSEVYWV